MTFSAIEYIDSDFQSYQEFVGSLSGTLPSINVDEYKNIDQFTKALVDQNKQYAKKIIDLFEELSKELSLSNFNNSMKMGGFDSAQNSHRILNSALELSSKFKIDGSPSKDGFEMSRVHLERKVEYLNLLVMDSKKERDDLEKIIHDLQRSNQDYEINMEKIEMEFQNNIQEKQKIEDELEKILYQYSIMSDEFEKKLDNALQEKELQIIELKRSIDNEQQNIAMSSRIPEQNEEIEELKEKIEIKDQLINELNQKIASEQINNSRIAHSTTTTENDKSIFTDFSEHLIQFGIKVEENIEIIDTIFNSLKNIKKRSGSANTRKEQIYNHFNSSKYNSEILQQFIKQDLLNRIDSLKIKQTQLLEMIDDQEVILNQESSSSFNTRESLRTPLTLKENLQNQSQSQRIFASRKSVSEQEKEQQYNQQLTSNANNNINNSITFLEVSSQLKKTTEKNEELNHKLEGYKRSLNRLNLLLQEEFDRLACIYEYSTYTSNIAEFKQDITRFRSKAQELMAQYSSKTSSVEELAFEYEKQKVEWQQQISKLAQQYDSQSKSLRIQSEQQKLGFNNVEQSLMEKVQILEENQKEQETEYRLNSEKKSNKICRLEESLQDYKEKVSKLEHDLTSKDGALNEREEAILTSQKLLSEWQEKCQNIENDQGNLLIQSDKQKQTVEEKDQLIEEKDEELERLSCEKIQISQEKIQLQEIIDQQKIEMLKYQNQICGFQTKIEELEKLVIEKKKIFEDTNESTLRNHQIYVEQNERKVQEIKQNYENLINQYLVQIDEQSKQLYELKQNCQSQLEERNNQIKELIQKTKTSDELLKSQESGLKIKDQSIDSLRQEIRELIEKLKSKEDIESDLMIFKEKAQKYFQLLNQSNSENSTLRAELQNASHERNESILKCQNLQDEVNQLTIQAQQNQREFNQTQHVLEDYSNEIQSLKAQIDDIQQQFSEQQFEINEQHTQHILELNNDISTKESQIKQQLQDIDYYTSELKTLQEQRQQQSEEIEKLQQLNDELAELLQQNDMNINQVESLNNINDELLIEIEALKDKLQQNEDSYLKEIKQFRSDLINANKKIKEFERISKKEEKEASQNKKISNADIFSKFMSKNQ